MAITITNRGQQLLIVQLNDGRAVYLAPGEASRPVEEMQISGNAKVSKLTRDNLVSVSEVKTKEEAPPKAAPQVTPAAAQPAAAAHPAAEAQPEPDSEPDK